MDHASFSLDSLPPADSACPHCGKSEHSVSHGYLYKQVSSDRREVVGKRILCSQHNGRKGCGRTRQWYLADVVPGRQYRLPVFTAFVYALLAGETVEIAYLNAIGANVQPRHAWRWLLCFLKQLPEWRTRLSPATEVMKATQRSATLRMILPTLKALSDKLRSLSHIQTQYQQRFC